MQIFAELGHSPRQFGVGVIVARALAHARASGRGRQQLSRTGGHSAGGRVDLLRLVTSSPPCPVPPQRQLLHLPFVDADAASQSDTASQPYTQSDAATAVKAADSEALFSLQRQAAIQGQDQFNKRQPTAAMLARADAML